MPRVVTVGRLDYFSEGLLLLTNDGGLAAQARAAGQRLDAALPRARARRGRSGAAGGARKGITIEGVRYGAIEARLDRQQRTNAWIDIALTEGKNREVRRVLAHLDLPVMRLIRVAFGPFYLGELERGQVEEVPAQALASLFGVKDPRARKAGPSPAADARPNTRPRRADDQGHRRQAPRPVDRHARGR